MEQLLPGYRADLFPLDRFEGYAARFEARYVIEGGIGVHRGSFVPVGAVRLNSFVHG